MYVSGVIPKEDVLDVLYWIIWQVYADEFNGFKEHGEYPVPDLHTPMVKIVTKESVDEWNVDFHNVQSRFDVGEFKGFPVAYPAVVTALCKGGHELPM